MILYFIPTQSRFVGTQAEAKTTGEPFEKVDVPVDKEGLMQYLNSRPTPTPSKTSANPPRVRTRIRISAQCSRSSNK